ncbi:immunity protein Imm33 domain-containing protein [Flavobacterium cerinum]|uniref:Imm33-like domain-containing protein n=1 Tax=Flavobacterium cerinum TaxID=2502784 RepID=A0ABY5ISW6_9FLAO|nr:hypothetical protein [Flavobacterium cerinum]UUC44464.1 hypothetical protein NOX80_12580 [Flavobacterium cerinum]
MGIFNKIKALMVRDIAFYADGDHYYSKGLEVSIGKELKIAKYGLTLEELNPILHYLVEFIQDEKPVIKHGNKLTCFSWLILAHEEENFFEILEINPEQRGFAAGLNRTLNVLNQQLFVCDQLKVEPNFPDFDQIVSVDPLVKTGLPTHLFRWLSDFPDSGWVALTDNFDEETMSFEEMTVGQLMTLRPELIKFMALPFGYKVIWDGKDAKIAFDNNLINN